MQRLSGGLSFKRGAVFKAWRRASGTARQPTVELPLRSELFNVEQLRQHALALAAGHTIDTRPGRDRLLPRLTKNEKVLFDAYSLISAAVEANRSLEPAGEWLLDNFYLIEEQIRTARRHLPKTYSRELPRVAHGPAAGYPRVYDIALELISHIDGKVDTESLSGFIAAYQTASMLQLGELWAIPIMLRLALIENLRRVAARISSDRIERDLADQWADRMLDTAERYPQNLILVMADMARSDPSLSSAFVAELARRLQGQSPAVAFALTWIEQRLQDKGLSIEQMVRLESQQQAADQVSIGNSIGSLRFLDSMDWREFVEAMSFVEQTLRADPAAVYADMDFGTRDRFRHVIERIAKRSPRTEYEVAHSAIELAQERASRTRPNARDAHVGFFLADRGLPDLERAVGMRLSLRQILGRFGRRHATALYLGTIFSITALVTVAATGVALSGDEAWALPVIIPAVALAASQLGVTLVNWLIPYLVPARQLARMDFDEGIPSDARTVVAIPTMLASPDNVQNLLESIEIHYLANRDEQLRFVLLTDFRDAPAQSMPDDEALLSGAREGIERLNEKHQSERGDVFFLLHRPRQWNPQAQVWMGYERKRGKLADLNAFLRGKVEGDRFLLAVGDTRKLIGARYVITLDTDTKLPRDAARRLVATSAHPLNRPLLDPDSDVVREGYTILQPRVATSLASANRSWFVRIYGGEPGVDPYTRVVSDVYQDVFGEGSFIGKGIYDVEAFEQTLSARFPENRILSHDLLEGCYARSALVSDVELYEEYPSRYLSDASRRHRWVRGDWQIAAWLLPRVPDRRSGRGANPLSRLSRWKIFDNLRRSLVPSALAVLLLLSWLGLGSPGFWTLLALSIIFTPAVLGSLSDLVGKPKEVPWMAHGRSAARSLSRHLAQAGLTLALLPHEAYYSLDAMVRTAYRVLVSQRRLLEWTTASEAEQNARHDLVGSYRAIWTAPLIAIVTLALLITRRPAPLVFVGFVLTAWCVAPAIAWWISRPIHRKVAGLRAEDLAFLHRVARKTWRFFETFVGPEDNWLPPDNYQEYPVAVIAHRTSPTNIGLSLLANLAAYDFGYLPRGKLLERTAATIATLLQLERYRGHFYNWYDTRSLAPLVPLYVSTVDSGNLVGSLLTLQAGLAEQVDHRIIPLAQFQGLVDTIDALLDVAASRKPPADKQASSIAELLTTLREIGPSLQSPPTALTAERALLGRLASLATDLLRATGGTPHEEISLWASTLERNTRECLEELEASAAWVLSWSAHPVSCPDHPLENAALDDCRAVLGRLEAGPTLREVSQFDVTLLPGLDRLLQEMVEPGCKDWLTAFRADIARASDLANKRIDEIQKLILQCDGFCDVEYGFLFDRSRNLFSIGYNVDKRHCDPSYYDLLASEARLCSFVAIAQGRLAQDHWFAMGRLLTVMDGEPVLLSWSGSMFEYLMPLLMMPSYENSLLEQTCKAAVRWQIEYATQRGVPWGISESGYNVTDAHLSYQYRAFGVPGLGFKRGLADDLVIAPYATMLALMVSPEPACANLQRMAKDGYMGAYGFYEAIDFTPGRVPRGQKGVVVRSFMAHHQGMGFLSIAQLSFDRVMQRRFNANPAIRASELLLQERIPKAAPFFPHSTEVASSVRGASERESLIRVYTNPNTPVPEVHLLSNGRYHVAITNAGGGYSRWNDLGVTRWYEDTTRDNRGIFCYLRDVASGKTWSSAHQPLLASAEMYEAIFLQGRAEFRRREFGIETHTEVAVSPEDDIELRRLKITNRSRVQRKIEVTSYAEVILTVPAADAAHPAFSNLFVQTEIVRLPEAILCTRRPRSSKDHLPWMVHLMATQAATDGATSFETDRSQFIGRARSTANPQAMHEAAALAGHDGSVLDPIVAIRRTVIIEPDETVTVDMVVGIADSRESALALAHKYHDRHLGDRVFDLSWTHAQVMLQQLNITEGDAQLYGRLVSPIMYAQAGRRAPASILIKNRRGQSGLWGYGISGDSPIVLVRIADQSKIELVHQMVQAHAYWRTKGLAVDLVIWNEDQSGYRQVLHDQIMGLIAAGAEAGAIERPGGIFVRRAEQMPDEDRVLMLTIARVIVSDTDGSLAEQIDRRMRPEAMSPPLKSLRPRPEDSFKTIRPPSRELQLFNGIGGFSPDGREYVIATSVNERTPAPWANVLANSGFGTVISESGGAYTWAENAHEFRLTPWYNDPVTDATGEAFYIRDDESGRFWSPTPLPAGGEGTYVTRHGFGYSVFEGAQEGLNCAMSTYVAVDAPVKFVVLRLRNDSSRPRRFSVFGYVEWALGEMRSKSLLHLTTEIDGKSGAVLARNPFNVDFVDRVAFFDVSEMSRHVTGDRTEFVGRNGTLASPAALARTRLSGKVGAALDPCAAMQVQIEMLAGQQREVIFVLGAARSLDEARTLIQRFRGSAPARLALESVQAYWQRTLTTVTVNTPDSALDLLANGWLIYQTLACRFWARSGYYQSGGAFGFRDQLQDVTALVYAEPRLTREHLLRCAAHQFREGDVQHWWHPPTDRGVRTHFSDDFLWLPWATSRYVVSTGDTGVLDERVHYLEGRPCNPDEEAYYDLPSRSEQAGPLYEHCVRAIRNALRFGAHGLPLMGCGDWNDGMNLVGAQGKGESVWLALFLYDVLMKFSPLALQRGDTGFADECREHADKVRRSFEENAWDGRWYLRAFFDDGEPLGSAADDECQIDSLPQSWAVLSGAGDPERATTALNEVERRLVRRDAALIQLFDPPFDKSELDPGYIKGYVPGVRENGGQYTHAAIWTIMAFAEKRDPRAWELFALINPLRHGASARSIATYKDEPYVVAADVYAMPPHVGRGGWSWYTGSAGWMYRLILESLLGLKLEADRLTFAPYAPADWKSFEVRYRYRNTLYEIKVVMAGTDQSLLKITKDGALQPDRFLRLLDDGGTHAVEFQIG